MQMKIYQYKYHKVLDKHQYCFIKLGVILWGDQIYNSFRLELK